MPSSMWRVVFSSTTTASSTTNPVAIVSAISVKLLIENPARYMAPNVPTSDTGTATIGTSVARPLRRKTNTTRITSTTAMTSARPVSRSDARIVTVRSIATPRSMSAGIDALNTGISAWTRSTVSMMFAFGCRKMMTATDGLALAIPALRTSCTESTTSATADSATGASLRQATISGRYSAAVFAWSLARTCQWRSPASSAPFGRLALAAASAVRTSSRPTPYLDRASGLSSTRTAGSELPPTVTWPTPSICESFCARIVDAASYIWPCVFVSDVSVRIMIGASAGFTLR